jgi:hypothetical protein
MKKRKASSSPSRSTSAASDLPGAALPPPPRREIYPSGSLFPHRRPNAPRRGLSDELHRPSAETSASRARQVVSTTEIPHRTRMLGTPTSGTRTHDAQGRVGPTPHLHGLWLERNGCALFRGHPRGQCARQRSHVSSPRARCHGSAGWTRDAEDQLAHFCSAIFPALQ